MDTDLPTIFHIFLWDPHSQSFVSRWGCDEYIPVELIGTYKHQKKHMIMNIEPYRRKVVEIQIRHVKR